MGADTVSVIVPTRFRNVRLREAIESVPEQTDEPVELVVVDDVLVFGGLPPRSRGRS